jgi:hypothetical protein
MRKIIIKRLESFKEKDLKNYSRIVNRYFKRKLRFVFVFILASCSVQKHTNKDDFKKMPKQFNLSFYDKLDTIQHHYGNQSFTRSFIAEFSDKKDIDFAIPIELKLQNEYLYIKFQDILKKQVVIKVKGKRHRKRFVFYTNYETISFPIIFISKELTKYTLELPDFQSVLIKRNYTSEGMVLLFGGSSSSENEYIFKILRNE